MADGERASAPTYSPSSDPDYAAGRVGGLLLIHLFAGSLVSFFGLERLENGLNLLITLVFSGVVVLLGARWLTPTAFGNTSIRRAPDLTQVVGLLGLTLLADCGVIVLRLLLPSASGRPELTPSPDTDVAFMLLAVGVAAPLVEEFVFREVALSEFKAVVSPRAALLAVTFLFALVHGPFMFIAL